MTVFAVLDPTSLLFSGTGGIKSIDISAYSATDYISVSMPAYPATSINPTQSYLELTSNPTGDFAGGPTDSVAFSSDPNLPVVNGDAELRLPLSLFTNIDKSHVVGVRFIIEATVNCTFRALRIRACSSSWVYAPTDIDTLNNRLERPPSPDGSAAPTSGFPVTSDVGEPAAFPVLYRSDDPPSPADPRPIDVSMGISFISGSLVGSNEFALYLRQNNTEVITQDDLEGQTQAELEATQVQPEFLTTSGASSWIRARFDWDSTGSTLVLENSEGVQYTFSSAALSPNQNYWLVIELTDNVFRGRLFATDVANQVTDDPLLDTTAIVDATAWWRRKGRVGIYTAFEDGDVYLTHLRPRFTVYGDIITSSLNTLTPMDGGQLVAGSTSQKELVESIVPAPWGGTVFADPTAAISPTSVPYRIETVGMDPLQGFATNVFWVDQPAQTVIEFDLKFPGNAVIPPGQGLLAFLYGPLGLVILLNLPTLETEEWQHIRIPLANHDVFQTGRYSLVVVQTLPQVSTTWFIDNLSVKTPVVDWYGRAASDPWDMSGEWMPFKDTINLSSGGTLFKERGRQFQIRARSYRDNAKIHEFTANPKYAELGRFVWEDERVALGTAPAAHTIGTAITGQTVKFTATWGGHPTYFTSNIVAYGWSFGDDSFEYGPIVKHTYRYPGTYDVTLTVISRDRAQSVATTTVTV